MVVCAVGFAAGCAAGLFVMLFVCIGFYKDYD